MYTTTTVHATNPRSWSVPIIAKALCDLDCIVNQPSALVARGKSILSEPIRKFISFMDAVRLTVDIAKARTYKRQLRQLLRLER